MSGSPILRSFALQRALALTPVRRPVPPTPTTNFAATLAKTQTRSAESPPPATPPTAPAATRAAAASVSSSGTNGVPFHAEISAAARKYGIDPALLAGLVKQESNFNPNAQSGVGARGLTQLMDATAKGLGVTNSFDPAQSLDGGAKFLSGLLKQFHGDASLALAAYNAGPGAVQKYGGIPPYEETRRYVPKVLGYADQFRRIWADAE